MSGRRATKRRNEDGPLRIRLTFDRGLAAWIRAWVAGIGLAGGLRETIIYLVRTSLNDDIDRRPGHDGLLNAMLPHLPPDIQRAFGYKPAKRRGKKAAL